MFPISLASQIHFQDERWLTGHKHRYELLGMNMAFVISTQQINGNYCKRIVLIFSPELMFVGILLRASVIVSNLAVEDF